MILSGKITFANHAQPVPHEARCRVLSRSEALEPGRRAWQWGNQRDPRGGRTAITQQVVMTSIPIAEARIQTLLRWISRR